MTRGGREMGVEGRGRLKWKALVQPSSVGIRAGSRNRQGVETPRPLVSAQKCDQNTKKLPKTPRDGAVQERVRRKHDKVVQEIRSGETTPSGPPGTVLQVEAGKGGGTRNGKGRTEPRREYPHGTTGSLTMSRSKKGGNQTEDEAVEIGLRCGDAGANRELGIM